MTELAAVSLGKVPFFFFFFFFVRVTEVCNSPQMFTTDNSNSIPESRVQHQGALRTRSSYTIVHTVEGSLFCFAFLFTDGIV